MVTDHQPVEQKTGKGQSWKTFFSCFGGFFSFLFVLVFFRLFVVFFVFFFFFLWFFGGTRVCYLFETLYSRELVLKLMGVP